MAIKIPFDNAGNPITPTFVLATKSGRKLGAIPASNIHISDKFNSYFDLCFKVHRYNNGVECNLWSDIKDFKLVWCPEWDVWFEIYVEVNETNDTVKNVSAKSVGEAELSQINLYDIQINTEDDIARDDYVPTVLCDVLKPEGSLLHRILAKAPHYQIDSVDSSIARIQRTFTFDNISIYDALQEIAQEINCIFVIDSSTDNNTGKIKRKIIVKDLESHCINESCDVYRINELTPICPKCGGQVVSGYGENTSIFVSTDNLADDINYSTNIDAVKNCFKLEAGDDLMTATIVNCNPNGSAYIWHIPEALKSDMSAELQDALKTYETEYSSYQTKSIDIGDVATYNTNIVNKYNTLKLSGTFNFEDLKSLHSPVTGYPALMTAYYDTVDAKILLESGLMPSPDISDSENKTPAQIQAEYILDKIKSLLSSGIAVVSGITTQVSYVNNALKSFLNSFLKSSFGIEIFDSAYSNNKWTGILEIFNRSGDSSCFINIGGIISNILNDISPDNVLSYDSIAVTSDVDKYRTQTLYKTLNSKINDETDIVAIFNSNKFADEIKKYSLKRLESFRDACQACLNLLIEQGVATSDFGLYSPYYSKLLLINAEIQTRQTEIDTIETVQNRILTQRNNIQQILDFQNYVTKYSSDTNLWLELAPYRRDDTYLNNNYISDGLNNTELFQKAQEFYEVAQKEIFKSATLQHSITSTLRNLLAMPEFRGIVDKFKVGNWIKIGVNDEVHTLRLLSYEIDFDNLNNIFVEFSDVKKTQNGLNDVESILSQAASMTTSYGAVAHQASQGQKGNKKLDTWVADGLALTQMKIINHAKNQTIVWDDGGLLCRRYNDCKESYEPEQLKIINSTIAFTDNNWQSVKTAIGKFYYKNPNDPSGKTLVSAYGVNAETIIGELIMGQQLMIRNSASTFKVTHNGISVSSSINDKDVVFTVNPNNQEDMICLQCGGEKMFGVDSTGKAFFKGDISGASGSFSGDVTVKEGSSIAGWYVGEYALCQKGYSNHDTNSYLIYTNKFQVKSDGTINATGGTFKGRLESATGKFTGELKVGSNFEVDTSGFLIATGAILKGSSSSSISFNKEAIDLGWTSKHESGSAAMFNGANVVTTRNVLTNAKINSNKKIEVVDDSLGAGLVHCGKVTDTSSGYGFSNGTSLKARFGLNSKGEAFIQITPLNDESTAYATFHFTPDGYIKITSNGRSTTL